MIGLVVLVVCEGLDFVDFFGCCDVIVYGMMVVDNMLIEMNGVIIGLLIIEGFCDEIVLCWGFKESIWDVWLELFKEIIFCCCCLGVFECVLCDGLVY